MPKTKISEFSSTPASNTDIDSIFIGEGMAPSNVNDAIRELMAQLKDWQSGTSNDPYVVGSSGSLTLNQGTANGVAYLNGSKVVTSGSALTFDGTNLGIGAATPLKPLDISFAGTSGARRFLASYDDSVITIKGANASNDPEALRITGDNIRFNTGTSGSGSEQMRLTSTGLGIGTSSPTTKLSITDSTGPIVRLVRTSNRFELSADTDFMSLNARDASTYITFKTADTERMRLDSSGNLGLGVTPSAWDGSFKALQVSNTSLFSQDSTGAGWWSKNARNVGGTWYYIGTGNASYIEQGAGAFKWNTAASGTAGNAITFSQAMTLDASGNLLVGTTSPSYNASNRGNITVGGSGSSIYSLQVSGTGVGHLFHDGTNATLSNEANGYLRFNTNATERARIDSSGNLLVGTTTSFSNGKLGIVFNGDTQSAITIQNSATTANTVVFRNSSGTTIGTITNTNTATAYNTSSDYRLKNTIAPMTGALAKVALLKPVTYKWNADGSDGEGFIAHELAEVVPQCVTGEKDAVDEEGNPKYQGIDTSFLVATLTAAIQELKAEFDAYKASHP